jgi:uncharacterized membrane protein YfcA
MEQLLAIEAVLLALGAAAGLACGFLNTAASSGSAVSLPILMMIGLDPITANATNRLPVLIGALTATGTFQRRRQVPWGMVLRVSLPLVPGVAAGVGLAELIPARTLGLAITAAVLVAFVLLFTKVKAALARAETGDLRFGPREYAVFFGIGSWLGFIVLDGATYLLLALVLGVQLPLIQANAAKSALLIPASLVAVALFALDGAIDWKIGAALAVGSVAGGVLGARLAGSVSGKKWIYRLLVVVILAELVHLGVHYAAEVF